ncbi:MAG: TetR/AcrR family transcriptional regulator [Saprospiraceae bacterium]|jgi:TetR/AcrR family transcriptional regulator|nr:TetR/AcrR family transcriptional regulator [Saprospiraceae bacterium]
MDQSQNTEERITAAAKEIFIQRGFAGARMQDIADKAGINKAMLHYYFRSKEKLFEVIFDEAFGTLMPRVQAILSSDKSVIEKFEDFADQYIALISEHPHVPLFVVHELSQDPDRFVEKIRSKGHFPKLSLFIAQLQQEVDQGRLRPYNPVHLMMNVLSMCIFPFVAKPMLKAVTQMDETTWNLLMQNRSEEVKRFLKQALIP